MRRNHRVGSTILFSLAVALAAPMAAAVDTSEMTPANPGPSLPAAPVFLDQPAPDEELFVGTGAFSGSVANPAFTVDVDDGSSTQSFSGTPVGGAAFDAANSRVLFTSSFTTSFAEVWSWPLGGAPTQVGTITFGGQQLRIDGLAFLNGTLYGVQQFDDTAVAPAGIFSIDTSTWVATSVVSFPTGPAVNGAISGLAADPTTGLLYGPNDTSGTITSIDPGTGTATNVAAYPGGESDIDGMTFGGGILYLVPDQAGSIYPYDIAGGTYLASITSPFTSSDTFSGAAFLAAAAPADADLALQMTCGVGGAGVDCTVTVENLGPDDATGVEVAVTVPTGLTYSSDTCSASAAGGIWTWSQGSLANGASDSCTLSMTVDAGATGPWTMVGTVTHAGNDPNPSNDRSTRQVSLVAPVPTLSQVGVLVLVVLLALAAVFVIRRAM